MNTLFDSCRLTLLASLIAATTLATGCSSKQVAPEISANTAEQSQSAGMPSSSNAADRINHEESITTSDIVADSTAITPEPTAHVTVDTMDTEGDEANLIDASRPARLTFNFGFNQAKLDADSQQIIEQHGRFLAEHPELKLVINGHSDAQGNSRYNDILAQKRAEHVADLLMSQGAVKEQIEILSWGSSSPLASAQHHREQRRVEIQYLDEYLVQSAAQ